MESVQNPLSNSDTICSECKYLLKRLITPLDDAQFDINRDDLNIPDDSEIVLEHYMCTEVGLDLDYVVIKCNKFEPAIENTLLRNNF